MKEPHIEGVAIQGDPESCVVDREVWCEAFTGACTGAALMHHITPELLRSSFLSGPALPAQLVPRFVTGADEGPRSLDLRLRARAPWPCPSPSAPVLGCTGCDRRRR